ncbi:hypothetical protein Leryth_006118 [Lithospermum erythrorhizon]|uniref:BHLH domain-containing protein n=1 Tax=Lithospermum erythrorhizon TaxID=34254 RepID=A0AAV3Q9A1_LITER|nr:hypothetical protein Leryth_006118 [Lithospermum erythrorhizon]
MATHFTQDFQNLKQSFSGFHDIIDSNMEIITNFPLQSFQNPGRYSLENLPIPGPEFPGNFAETFPGGFIHEIIDVVRPIEPVNSAENDFHNGKKRKSVETPESSWANSSPPPSPGNLIRRENSSGKGKKVKNSEIGDKKEEGVVHVRARRGQATDSHSLAERARRGKINERLKCLQSIVPGCYKTMGMAVMLDEIINYVQSLQNQVEFLSMKLSAASTFQDFNFETDQFMQAMQRANAYEAMKMEKIASEGFEGAVVSNQVCPLFDMNFGGYPSLPFNK